MIRRAPLVGLGVPFLVGWLLAAGPNRLLMCFCCSGFALPRLNSQSFSSSVYAVQWSHLQLDTWVHVAWVVAMSLLFLAERAKLSLSMGIPFFRRFQTGAVNVCSEFSSYMSLLCMDKIDTHADNLYKIKGETPCSIYAVLDKATELFLHYAHGSHE